MLRTVFLNRFGRVTHFENTQRSVAQLRFVFSISVMFSLLVEIKIRSRSLPVENHSLRRLPGRTWRQINICYDNNGAQTDSIDR